MPIVAGLLVIVNAEAIAVVVAPMVLLIFPLTAPPVDDVACVAVVVDGAAGVHVSWSAFLVPVPTTRLPIGGGPIDRKGSATFLVVLNIYCHYHRLDPSNNRCGSVVLGQHGLDRVTEHLGDEDVLMWGGEDILVTHLCL